MLLSCLQENLNHGLNIVSRISDKNTSLPILNNILIKTENKNIKLISTNLEIGINCAIRGKVEEDGEITIPGKILADYISLLPNDKINIELKGDEAHINCDSYSTKIKGTPSSDFPLIPSIKKEECASVDVAINDLKSAIGQVIFAIAANEARPEISGIYISAKDNILTLAATDSYRLAEKKIKILAHKNAENAINTIIPYKTLNELGRILSSIGRDDEISKEQETISIYLTDNQILFSCKNIELISRTIDARYPDYKQIIPTEFKTKAILDVKTLANAVKAASLFTKTGIYDISLLFNPTQNKLKISSLNNQLGENKSDIDSAIEGEEVELILNFRYLLDGLQNINSEKILFKITDHVKPFVISPLDSEDKEIENYIYLIMPIKQ
ncbi:MAG: DNA polymerase III subunit beta [bacterium]